MADPDGPRLEGLHVIEQDFDLLPAGLTVVRTIHARGGDVCSALGWSPDGRVLAVASSTGTIELFEGDSGKSLHVLSGHRRAILSLSFSPHSDRLASSSADGTVRLWNVSQGTEISTFLTGCLSPVSWAPDGLRLATVAPEHVIRIWDPVSRQVDAPIFTAARHAEYRPIVDLVWASDSRWLASASSDACVWEVETKDELAAIRTNGTVLKCAWSPQPSRWLAAACSDHAVRIWDATTQAVTELEAHEEAVSSVSFSHDGKFLASASSSELCIWVSGQWDLRARWKGIAGSALAFHPHRPWLAVPSDSFQITGTIPILQLDAASLRAEPVAHSLTYATAKIILVGDSGVGKTGLGWRLAYGEFKEHASTHGQQFWPWTALDTTREDGTQCEAILWDLAGQPDYRLVHALFLDDADLALVLFDPTRTDDPLHGVDFWLKQFQAGPEATPTLLIAARADRGSAVLTADDLDRFCTTRGVRACHSTSARTGDGVDDLIDRIKGLIRWDRKPATVTTHTFKRIKDHILALKADPTKARIVVSADELRLMVQSMDARSAFGDAELLTVVGHLENHGYVKQLRTSAGETRILLAPELLNNVGASIVLEARRNPQGLGSLDEAELLSGGYRFPELDPLEAHERQVLIDSAALMFLRHNVCFRETDPLTSRSYLIFPDLINLKRPAAEEDEGAEDGVSYTVTGSVEHVYASLVVLLGYTKTFTRTNQWHNHARYVVGNEFICGFRLETEREGELDFVLYYGLTPVKRREVLERLELQPELDKASELAVPTSIRTLFQSLCETFLARRNLTVRRYEPLKCENNHFLDSALLRKLVRNTKPSTFCNECGKPIAIRTGETIQFARLETIQVEEQRRTAEKRTRFEQAIFRLQLFTKQAAIRSPECFISYAWGDPAHERWVEQSLARDLQKAGLKVLLDRWDNARVGASVTRFIDRIATADKVLVVGTPAYRDKYSARSPMGRYVVAAEGDLIGWRLISSEAGNESAFPLLLAGSEETSFPPLLLGRVYADFRDAESYFTTMFDVILSVYAISVTDTSVADLRESLRQGTY